MNNTYSSIILIIPYFGKLPSYFIPWLISAKANPTIDFLIFTDDTTDFDYPTNVKRVICSFDDVKHRIQKIFDFEVCINQPYKLCDFKPTYGEAFSEYIENYDFWGFCDIDLIFGDIRKYLTEEVLHNNIRIFEHGPFSLYKNQKEVNAYYRTLTSPGCMYYKDVYSRPELMAYDEIAMHNGGGTAVILKRNNKKVFSNDELFLPADDLKARLYNKHVGYFYVQYEDGHVYLCSKNAKTEQLFFHFHLKKKYCEIPEDLCKNRFYYVSPGKFINNSKKASQYKLEILKLDFRYIFKRIYMLMGEPKWKWITKMLR